MIESDLMSFIALSFMLNPYAVHIVVEFHLYHMLLTPLQAAVMKKKAQMKKQAHRTTIVKAIPTPRNLRKRCGIKASCCSLQ